MDPYNGNQEGGGGQKSHHLVTKSDSEREWK